MIVHCRGFSSNSIREHTLFIQGIGGGGRLSWFSSDCVVVVKSWFVIASAILRHPNSEL